MGGSFWQRGYLDDGRALAAHGRFIIFYFCLIMHSKHSVLIRVSYHRAVSIFVSLIRWRMEEEV